MPFQSEKQRRFLWASHPDIAKRWAQEYPESNKNLPLYAHACGESKGDSAKTAAVDVMRFAANKWANITNLMNINTLGAGETKAANSGMMRVPVPNSEKPTYAGQEQEKGTAKPVENTDCSPSDIRNSRNPKEQDENAVAALFGKLSAVLAQPLREALEAEQAMQGAREPRFVPSNLGMRQFSAPSPTIAPPMGMAAAPGQPQPVAQAQPQPMQQPANTPSNGPVGGGSNPQFNPINAFGAIGAKGQLNGNAAFGQKNSPGSSKMSSLKNYTGQILVNQHPHRYRPVSSKAAAIGAKISMPQCSCGCGDTVITCKCGPDCKCRKPGGSCCKSEKTSASSPAWQRSEGKSNAGGLNENGRKSYEQEHGGNLQAPVTESNPSGDRAKRQNSFCSRMCGMKSVNTGAATAKDPDSRINKSLRKWNCKCSSAAQFGVKLAAEAPTEKISMPRGLGELPQGAGPDQIADAIMRFNQLRTLVRPTDETLRGHNLSRKGFQGSLRKITAHSQGKDRFDLNEMAPNPKLRAALTGLAGLGAAGGLAYTGNTEVALGALPATALAAGSAYLHGQHERGNILNTAKLMKQYGLLKPKLLQQAYPLLGDEYRVA